MSNVVIVDDEGGDWEGLYVDGTLVYENHEIPRNILIEHVQGANSVEYKEADEEWLFKRGTLTKNLSDVKFAEEE
jgi:hypothetical protein